LSEDAAASPAEQSSTPAVGAQSTDESAWTAIVFRDVDDDPTLVQTMIHFDDPPLDMAFDASLRAGDQTWSLGPVSWFAHHGKRFAFNADLPVDIVTVEIVLTPDPAMAARVRKMNPETADSDARQDDRPMVLQVDLHRQDINMCKTNLPTSDRMIQEALAQLDASSPAALQLSGEKDVAQARVELQRRLKEDANDIRSRYALGCLDIADRDLMSALSDFAAARRPELDLSLSRLAQQKLRTISSVHFHKARKGDLEACYQLGFAYERGWGVGQNYQSAKRWLRNAANGGHAEAMRSLASLYESRLGAVVHTTEADDWYDAQARDWRRKANRAAAMERTP
jgi:hypothetical protein